MGEPKYIIVQNWIKGEIYKLKFKKGDKIPSENELMKRFGYSRQTIRLAIRNLEEQGLLMSIKGSGTYVHHENTPSEREAKNFGVVLNNLTDPEQLEIMRGIEQTLAAHGHSLTLAVTYNRLDKESDILNTMMDNKIDGIIAEGTKTAVISPSHNIYRNIRTYVPCVFLHSAPSVLNIPCVSLNDRTAGYMATKHLLDMGHKKIAAILRADEMPSHRRFCGYMDALFEAGIKFTDDHIMWYDYYDMEDVFEYALGKVFLKKFTGCTAIICHNERVVKKLINFLQSINIKPFDDISIMSMKNSEYVENINVTAIDYDKYSLGEHAAKLCMKMLNNQPCSTVLLSPKLISRDSVHKIQ